MFGFVLEKVKYPHLLLCFVFCILKYPNFQMLSKGKFGSRFPRKVNESARLEWRYPAYIPNAVEISTYFYQDNVFPLPWDL